MTLTSGVRLGSFEITGRTLGHYRVTAAIAAGSDLEEKGIE